MKISAAKKEDSTNTIRQDCGPKIAATIRVRVILPMLPPNGVYRRKCGFAPPLIKVSSFTYHTEVAKYFTEPEFDNNMLICLKVNLILILTK